MKKFLALMLLATTPVLGSFDFGCFWVENVQTVDGPTGGVYSAVVWNPSNEQNTHDIRINRSSQDEITIEERGTYIARFTILGTAAPSTSYRFALELNGVIVPGGVFAVETVSAGVDELVGQVAFNVTERHSIIRLVNDSVEGLNVTLANVAGYSGATDNVTASIFIEQKK